MRVVGMQKVAACEQVVVRGLALTGRLTTRSVAPVAGSTRTTRPAPEMASHR